MMPGRVRYPPTWTHRAQTRRSFQLLGQVQLQARKQKKRTNLTSASWGGGPWPQSPAPFFRSIYHTELSSNKKNILKTRSETGKLLRNRSMLSFFCTKPYVGCSDLLFCIERGFYNRTGDRRKRNKREHCT